MQNIPQIFNGATFVEPPAEVLATLDPPTLARLAGVRTAYRNLEAANTAEADAIAHIKDCLEAMADAEDYRKKNFPPTSAHDEWIANFGSAEQRRALAQRFNGGVP